MTTEQDQPVDHGRLVWMRCPYDADLCGADAVLTEFTTALSSEWEGILVCSNGHKFAISQ